MHFLTSELYFPPVDTVFKEFPDENDGEGLLAVGGDLSMERLLLAYNSGIFPWYDSSTPILWWSPAWRMVLFLQNFKVSKSLRSTIRKQKFKVSFNKNFKAVITQCANYRGENRTSTWITPEMKEAYIHLHALGHAMSVEVWLEGELVGGLYGIDLPDRKIFCGESMFSKISDASKVAFYYLVQDLKRKNYKLVDCQIYNEHLSSLGAVTIPRAEFIELLEN